MTAAALATPQPTLADLIAEGRHVRDEVEALNRQIKDLEARRRELDLQILELLQAQGVNTTRTDVASVSVSTQQTASVTDWDQLYQYIQEHNAFHLLHRRISAAAAHEIVLLDGELPGVEVSEVPKLNFTRR